MLVLTQNCIEQSVVWLLEVERHPVNVGVRLGAPLVDEEQVVKVVGAHVLRDGKPVG